MTTTMLQLIKTPPDDHYDVTTNQKPPDDHYDVTTNQNTT